MSATVTVDPRIRARRIAVRRAQGRRRLRRLVAVAALAVLAGGAWAAARSPILDVDEIEVTGATNTGIEPILTASGIVIGDQLMDVDVDDARRAITTLPWVKEASVRRDWTGAVRIAVVEREPVAAVPVAGGTVRMAADGTVVDRVSETVRGLVTVALPDGPLDAGTVREDAAGALRVVTGLTPDLAAWVDRVVVDDDGTLELDLVGSASARFGMPDAVPEKLMAVATVLGRVELSCLVSIDVTVPDAPIARRAPGCEASGTDDGEVGAAGGNGEGAG